MSQTSVMASLVLAMLLIFACFESDCQVFPCHTSVMASLVLAMLLIFACYESGCWVFLLVLFILELQH